MTMRAGEVYEHLYERLVVRVGTAESDGRELIADLYVRAGVPGVPRHIHPAMEESLTVVRAVLIGPRVAEQTAVENELAAADGMRTEAPRQRLERAGRRMWLARRIDLPLILVAGLTMAVARYL